jgi:hypothetical protein
MRLASRQGNREREARSLVGSLDALRYSSGGIDARIVKVDGTRAYINIGASNGVNVGDKFSIIHRGEETGTGVVIEVNERFAIINVAGTAVTTDVIKKM